MPTRVLEQAQGLTVVRARITAHPYKCDWDYFQTETVNYFNEEVGSNDFEF